MFKRTQNQKQLDRKVLASGASALTGGFKPKQDELAEITSYSPTRNVYQVVTRGAPGIPEQPAGKTLSVPRRVESPGTTAPLPLGTVVVLNWGLGFPYIAGVLNVDATPPDNEADTSTALSPEGVISSAALEQNGAYYREPNAPTDAMPGDWVHIGADGNRVGVLRGGYSFLGSGPAAKARFETHQNADLARIVTENYEVITGFGIMKIHNADGRCGLSFRAAADQLHESGGSEEQWTFKLDIGDTGQYFQMEVCSSSGATQAKVSISADGQVTIMSTNGLSFVDGGTGVSHQEYASSLVTKIMKEFKETILGDVEQKYQSNRSTRVSAGDSRIVGANDAQMINGTQNVSIAGSQRTVIAGGNPLEAKPSNVAVEQQIYNGSLFVELGNPLQGANPTARAGATIIAHNGTITLGSNPSLLGLPSANVTVALNTLLPGSVILGGTKLTAPFGGVLFEPLACVLTTMAAMIDSHIHIPPVGPPIVPISPVVVPAIMSARSSRVRIGA